MKRITALILQAALLGSAVLAAPAFSGHVNPPWDHLDTGSLRFTSIMPITVCIDTVCGPVATAVLDKETGLVWELSPFPTPRTWFDSIFYCNRLKKGGRMGWRVPTVEELASLLDLSKTSGAALPNGHPFVFTLGSGRTAFHWAATTQADATNKAWAVDFVGGFQDTGTLAKSSLLSVWCVRGQQGYDGQ